MQSHECCSNEKQVSSLMLKIFRLCSAKREHQIQSALMICINYCIQCLRGASFSECGLRVRSAMCDALFTGQMMVFHRRKLCLCNHYLIHFFMRFRNRLQALRPKWSGDLTESGGLFLQPLCGSHPGTFATSLLHTAAVMVPPGQDCVLCSVCCGNHPRTAGRNTF